MRFTSVLLTLSFISSLFAQRSVSIGIESGYTASTIQGDEVTGFLQSTNADFYEKLYKPTVSATIETEIQKRFNILASISYMQRGFSLSNRLQTLHTTTNYILLSALPKFQALSNSSFTIGLSAGPALEILLKAEELLDNQAPIDVYSIYKPTICTMNYGLHITVPVHRLQFRVSSRYNHQIGNLFSDDAHALSYHGYAITAGILFSMDGKDD